MFHQWRRSKRIRRTCLTLALALCAVVSQVVLTSPVRAETNNSKLSVVSWGSGRLDVFTAKYNHSSGTSRVWVRTFWNGWTDWSQVAEVQGNIVSIDTVSWGPGRIDLIAVSQNFLGKATVLHKFKDESTGYFGWQPVGGTSWVNLGTEQQKEFSQGVQAISWGPNRLDLVPINPRETQSCCPPSPWYAGSPAFFHKHWNGSAWMPSQTGWNTVSGRTDTEYLYYAISSQPGRLDVFRAPNDEGDYLIQQNTHADLGWFRRWSGWSSVNNGLSGHRPYAVSPASGDLDLFVRGTDGAIWGNHYDSGYWGWYSLGTGSSAGTAGSPSAVATAWFSVNVFENRYFGGSYGGDIYRKGLYLGDGDPPDYSGPWTWLGNAPFQNAPEAVSWGTGRIDLFGLGTDGLVYHKWSNNHGDGASWGPSQTTWESLGAPPNL